MTTPSAFEGAGLSIVVKTPLNIGESMIGNYTAEVSSYTHSISANGGYNSADIVIGGNLIFAEDWLQNGLGRHVEIYGASLQLIWEGFVNLITVNMGYATFTRGPLLNIANRVSAVYTPIFVDPITGLAFNPKITGTTTETVIVENTLSQEMYGIWEKVLNIGEATDADAAIIRDLYLEEYAFPEGNPSISISGVAEEFSVTLQCRGYIDWLGYVYNHDNGTTDCISLWASDKIVDILQDDPNDIISTDYSKIEFNGVLVCDNELDNKQAKNIIDDILTLGGGDDDRWTFGIYGGRKAIYSSVPASLEYIYYTSGKTQQIETIAGKVLYPWEVLPGKWVSVPIFQAGSGIMRDNIRDDPRIFFGEEVTYTAPDQITISGSKVRRLPQLLAKLGLGGI